MRLRPARYADITAIRALLDSAKLPDDDIGMHVATLVAGERCGQILVAGAIEPLGRCALLRSVVVDPRYRRRGWGQRMTQRLLCIARLIGIRDVFLLTTDKADFFATRGFARVGRESAPAALRRTRQFTSLCPSSATLMCYRPTAGVSSSVAGEMRGVVMAHITDFSAPGR